MCTVHSIIWEESEDEIVCKITANRFLHNMVRVIVGTMVEVGRGNIEPVQVKSILESKDRNQAGPTIPARGLCLVRIEY